MSPQVNILIPVSLPDWWKETAISRYRTHAGADTLITGSAFTSAQQEEADGGGLADVLLENAREAEEAGAGAHVIDCFGDPKMLELAARLRRPVTGVGHSAMHFAHAFAKSYAIITGESAGVSEILGNASRYGVDARLTACLAVEISAAQIPDRKEDALDRLESLTMGMGTPPEWIVLGCTELAELAPQLEARLRRRGIGTRVLNPLIATTRWAEAAAQAF